MTIKEQNEITKKYHKETPDNVVGVMMGKKTVGGKVTDEDSLIFVVEEKKPIEDIPEDELLPSKIVENGVSLTTDVIQMTFSFHQQCPTDFYDWTTTPPGNRSEIRPLQGGVSTTNYTSLSNYVGTLGFIGVDNDTNSLVGVSNNHVLINDAFIASDRNPNGVKTSIMNNFTTQPNDGGVSGMDYAIGIVKKYVPLSGTPEYNTVDCALTTVNQSDISNTTSYRQYGMDGWTTPLTFATTEEIDGLLSNNNSLFSSGRTTGPKGEGDMKLIPWSLSSTFGISYQNQGSSRTVNFSESIAFVASATTTPTGSVCYFPIAPGDSGSALVADFDGTRKIVGLVFAGASDETGQTVFAFANRIDNVASQMNISAWDGSSVNFSDTGNTMTILVSGLDDAASLSSGGNTYWQVGIQ
jgi:hypothetical protein